MFTGIVQSQAEVISAITENNLCRLVISGSSELITHLEKGASISTNGVCLTVVEFYKKNNKAYISFDVMGETLAISNLSAVSEGSIVNIERSLKMGDELGGHIVSGHVHCKASLTKREQTSSNCSLFFSCHPKWIKYVLPKGFITVNGISLTVGAVSESGFSVHLIPETLARTNLSEIQLDDHVNLEFDQQTITIVTTIERLKQSKAI